MPNVKFQTGDKSGAKKETSGIYNGETPPKGLYKVLVRRLSMKINRNNDHMLNCLVEIHEPAGRPKAKYNGYGFWWNGNITDDGAGYINQFLDAISGEDARVRKAFWNGKCRVSESPKKGKAVSVTAIGPLKIQAEGMPAVVSAYRGKPYKGQVDLRIGDWLLPALAESTDDDDVQEPDEEEVGAEYTEDFEVEDDEVEDDGDAEDAEVVDDDDDDGNFEAEPAEGEDEDDEPPF